MLASLRAMRAGKVYVRREGRTWYVIWYGGEAVRTQRYSYWSDAIEWAIYIADKGYRARARNGAKRA